MPDEPDQVRVNDAAVEAGLLTWERVLCSLAGAILATAGVFAVFLTSNQLGSATLVVVGAVMLVIGIQGTAVTRASKDAIQLQTRQRIARHAQEQIDEGRSEAALESLEAAGDATPQIERDPFFQAFAGAAYEKAVLNRVLQIAHALHADAELRLEPPRPTGTGRRADAVLAVPSKGLLIGIEVRYARRPYRLLVAQDVERIAKGMGVYQGVLYVVNVDRSSTSDAREGSDRVRVAVWRNPTDDDHLSGALSSIISAAHSR